MIYKNIEYADTVVQGNIQEYDITAAGANAMYAEGVVSKGLYDYWMSLPKKIRNIKIGYHIGDNNLQEARDKAINKYIDLFINENHIPDANVMEIATDALWLFNNKRITYTKFKNVEFRLDRCASILVTWMNLRFYYDSWSGEFFVRGYTEETPFVFKIKELLAMIDQNVDQITLYRFLHQLKMDILTEELQFLSIDKATNFVDWLIEQFIR
jgi:hypothetical protein